MTLLCLFRNPKAFVAQVTVPSWWSKGTGDTAPTLEGRGMAAHTAHHCHRLPLGSQATPGRVRRTREWERGKQVASEAGYISAAGRHALCLRVGFLCKAG